MTPLFSAPAELDLFNIWTYLFDRSGSEAVADRWIDRLVNAAKKITSNPSLGIPRPDLGAGFRAFPLKKYLLVYAETGRGVEIIRVIHGSRDLAAVFKTTDS